MYSQTELTESYLWWSSLSKSEQQNLIAITYGKDANRIIYLLTNSELIFSLYHTHSTKYQEPHRKWWKSLSSESRNMYYNSLFPNHLNIGITNINDAQILELYNQYAQEIEVWWYNLSERDRNDLKNKYYPNKSLTVVDIINLSTKYVQEIKEAREWWSSQPITFVNAFYNFCYPDFDTTPTGTQIRYMYIFFNSIKSLAKEYFK